VNNVIPQHVQQEISGMGSGVTSWDVVNEIVGDGVSNGLVSFKTLNLERRLIYVFSLPSSV
jgi:endo-1,4-beta-xylanase